MKLWSVAGALLIFLLGLPSILEAESRLKLVNTEVIYDGSRSLRVNETLCLESIKEQTKDSEKGSVFSRPFLLYFPFPPREDSWIGKGKPIIPAEPQFKIDFHRLSVNGTLIHWINYQEGAVHRIIASPRDVRVLPKSESNINTYALSYDLLNVVRRTNDEDSFDIPATGKWGMETQETLLVLQFPAKIQRSFISVDGVIYDYNSKDTTKSLKSQISYNEKSSIGNRVFGIALKTKLPAHQSLMARVRIKRNP